MIKLSRTGITTLKRQYRAVLLKCLLINAGILFAANGAMAADTWTELTTDTTQFMDDLHTTYPSWDRQDGAITGWGVDQILGMMSNVATNTDNAVALVNDGTKGNNALYTALGDKVDKTAITTGSAAGTISVAGTDVTVKDVATLQTLTDGSSGVARAQAALADGAGNIITSTYVANTRTVNGHALSSNVTLTATDVLDANQLLAVNSGIKAADVTQIGNNKTAIETLNGSASTTGSVANTVATALADYTKTDDLGTMAFETAADYTKTADLADVALSGAAEDVSYDKTASGLTATNVQAAIDELAGDVDDINALIGTPDGAKSGDQNSLLYGVAITGDTGVDGQKTVIGALKTVAEGAAGKAMNNVFTGTTNTFGAGENQQVIIGNTGSLTANTSLKVGTSETNMLYVSSAGTVIGAASAITGTSGALNMGGNDLTNIDDITATGKVSANSFEVDANNTFAKNSLTVGNGTNAAATLSGDTMTLSHGDVVATFKAETVDSVDMLHLSVAGTNENKVLSLDNDTQIAGTLDVAGDFAVNTDKFTVEASSGNTTVGGTLAVAGDTTIGEKFSVTAEDGSFSAADGAFVVDGSGNLTTTGLSHLDGGVNVNNKLVIGTDGTIATDGDLSVNGLAALQGGINVNNKFVVAEDGTTGINAGLTVTGATLLDSTLEVNGATTLNGATTINNTLDVTGATTLGSTLAVAGDTTVGEKFSITAEDGSFSAADGAFVVDGDGNLTTTGITHLDGGVYVGENFGVDPNGNVATKGTLYAEGVASLKGGIDVNEMFGVDAETGNVGTEGTLYVKGATTLDSTLDVTDVITAKAGVRFGADDTVAMTSASHGGAVAADASEQGQVVASIQSVADTRQAINADAIEVLGGIYSVSTEEGAVVSYNNTALAGTNGFDNAAGDLTEALTNYANHVAAATGLSYDETGANVTTYARADEVNYAGIADNTSLRDAIVQLDTNIGDAPETAGLNKVLTTKTVNANIDAVNTALGDVQTAIDNSHYGNGAADMSEMVSKVDNKLYALDRDVRKLKKEFKAGMASVAAMSALVPNARANGNTQLSVGTGAYDGHMAAAIGGFHWFNNNVMMNVGVAYGDSSEATYRAGLTFTW